MRLPSTAREALGFTPLVQARRADGSRIGRVPLAPAGVEPFVFLARRPAAERREFRLVVFCHCFK